MNIDPNATKYMVKAKINADGIVDKPDVVGAIFGQTEGLLGDELDLRDLQKSGRIGRIEVDVVSKGGKSEGIIYMSSSLDQVETVILASALETVDRVGPCKASINVLGIEDVRVAKREKIVERAKELLTDLMEQAKGTSADLTQNLRQSIQVEEITTYGKERCPAGPNVKNSEAIIIVEGRSDVLALLRAGIKNAIAVEGTNVPKTVQDLSREKVTTAFVDGDRGGELILRELFQTSEIDFVARAPRAHEVEEMSPKQIVKCLRNKVPGDQYMQMNGLSFEEKELTPEDAEALGETPAAPAATTEPAENSLSKEPERAESDDEYRSRSRHSRHGRSDDDDSYRGRSRHSRRDDENGHTRFNTESADRWKKKGLKEDSEPIDSQVVETMPVRNFAASPEPFSETPAEESATGPEPDKKPVTEEPAVEEPAEVPTEEPVETPAVEPGPTEEPPKRTLRVKRTPKSTKNLSPEQETLRDTLHDISGTRNSVLLKKDSSVIDKVEVKNLVNYLKSTESDEICTVVFDGVISQNILDISAEKGIKTLVCKRKGKITKLPADITVWTRDDLD
ncbi:MAG: DNA primase DnaG [Candidatus Methanomethylophilus sp.]|nr:DNA primase DnaG [Methanomethylophilus sp.]